jgi:hypothetical protein
MPKEHTEIEVEVVEIDGVSPIATRPQNREPQPSAGGDWQDWRQWQGRVRTLDSRWWPLWVFLGIIAVFLLLTFGLVFAIIYIIFQVIRKILSAFLR